MEAAGNQGSAEIRTLSRCRKHRFILSEPNQRALVRALDRAPKAADLVSGAAKLALAFDNNLASSTKAAAPSFDGADEFALLRREDRANDSEFSANRLPFHLSDVCNTTN